MFRPSWDGIENGFKDEKLRVLEDVKMEAAKFKAEADEKMNDLRSQLEDQTSTSHDANARQRDELLELRPFTFLGEIRYRELKQRWGQVFRADMAPRLFMISCAALIWTNWPRNSGRSQDHQIQAETQEGYLPA